MSWSSVELGSICEILDSKRKPITKNQRTDGPYPYYGATGIVDYIGSYIFDEKLILIGEDGAKWASGDKTAFIADGKYWVNNHAHVIKPNREVVCDEWLVYYFLYKDLGEYVSGLTVPKLNQGQLKIIPIPLPPLATQKKIVSKLNVIFAELDKALVATETNVKNSEALFQSYLDKLFEEDEISSDKVSIKDVCQIGDGNHSSKYPKKDEMVESGIPFIRSTNIVNGALSDKDLVFLTEDKHKELKKGHLKIGDILITNRGEIGKVAIVDERFENSNLNSQIAWLRCSSLLKNQYLFFFLMSAKMKFFYNDTKTGAALQQLPIGKIEKIIIPLPSMEVQIKRCDKFLLVQQKCIFAKTYYKNKAIQLSQFKNSILKQAFNGELVKD